MDDHQAPLTHDAPAQTLSCVIPHYGQPGPTRALIDMLQRQSRLPDEIVVSDDGSPTPMPDVDGALVVRREHNGGFGSAVNSGVRAASGDLVLILNSDLVIGSDFIADLLDAAAPWMPAVCSPRVVSDDGKEAPAGRRFPTTAHATAAWLTPLARWRHTNAWHRLVGHEVEAQGNSTVTVDWLLGACLLLPRSDFLAVDGFDERFFMNSEEVDLQRRLRERGLPAVYLGSVTAQHEGGGSSAPEHRRRWLTDGMLLYAEKWGGHGGRRRLQAGLAAATAVNAAVNIGRQIAGRGAHPLRTARTEWRLLRGSRR